MQRLFGSLPDQPPSSSEHSFDHKKSKQTKKNNSKTKSTQNKQQRVMSAKSAQKSKRRDINSFGSAVKAGSQIGQSLQKSQVPQRSNFFNSKAFKTSDSELVVNFEKFQRQLINNEIDARHEERLLAKSRKVGLENRRKKQISMKNKQKSLKQDQLNLQRAIFYEVSNQREIKTRDIQRRMLNEERQKVIEEKRKLKQLVAQSNMLANERLVAAQIKFENKAEELKETLKQMQLVKRVNEIDQKKVLRDLDKQLKAEHDRINEGLLQELHNQKERTNLIKDKRG